MFKITIAFQYILYRVKLKLETAVICSRSTSQQIIRRTCNPFHHGIGEVKFSFCAQEMTCNMKRAKYF